MKRYAVVVSGVLAALCLAGCSGGGASADPAAVLSPNSEPPEDPPGGESAGGDAATPEAEAASVDTATSYIGVDGALRTVDMRIWYPAGAPVGAAPLILVSHGGSGAEGAEAGFAYLGEAYASHGFVAAVLNHPASDGGSDSHQVDRPHDVSEAIDHLATFAMPADFDGTIETGAAGHIGHSWGAYTSHALAGAVFEQGTFRDPRVKAIVPMSPQGEGRFGAIEAETDIRKPSADNSWRAVAIPSFVIYGAYEADNPLGFPYRSDDWRGFSYARYETRHNKHLAVVPAADHADFGSSGPEDVADFVAENSLLFFELYLKGDGVDPCTIGTVEPRPGTRIAQDASLGCDAAHPARSAFSDLTYAADWSAGTNDASGEPMGGTEIVSLVAHRGALYAAAGNRDDGGVGSREGPMVLVKTAVDAGWIVDRTWSGRGASEICAMASIPFSTAGFGLVADEAEPMLLVAADDAGLTVWVRSEAGGGYVRSVIDSFSPDACITSMALFHDTIGGGEYLFVVSSGGSVYRGELDRDDPNLFRWTIESLGVAGPVTALARADDRLYAAVAPAGDPAELWRRIDGRRTSWERVWTAPAGVARLLGLSAFADAGAPYTDRLIAGTSDGDLLLIDVFETVGVEARRPEAAISEAASVSEIAAGGVLSVVDPATGEAQLVFGARAFRADGAGAPLSTAPDDGAYYFVRRAEGTLEASYLVAGAADLDRESLRAVRAVAVSPFPEDDGRALYFGGYDVDLDPERTKRDTAWIYRGALAE